jgi:3-hydroxyacyl-CoA dehydrogenase
MVVFVIDFSKAAKNALNPLGKPVRDYLWNQLETARESPHVSSVILTGGSHNFSAGADLTEFDDTTTRTTRSATNKTTSITLIDIVDAVEDFPKPVVAAICGNALGGGLELVLACHYRIATVTAILGLPEVTVGVIPGGGGTQRLPRLMGLQAATEGILTAKSMNANEAWQRNVIDAIVASPQELLEKAHQWAEWAELMPLDPRRVCQRTVPDADMAASIYQQASRTLLPSDKGGFVQHCALEALMASATQPMQVGKAIERECFQRAMESTQGKARRHAFFAIRLAQKPVASLDDVNKQHPLLSPKTGVPVAVIGAGTMGGGIAIVLLQAGFQVTLVDISKPALERGLKGIAKIVQGFVTQQKITSQQATQILSNLSSTQRLEDLTHVQLVVEAVVERMKIKKSIFQLLDQVTPPSCILLSNTSTLDIDEMASVLSPQRQTSFAGWHFFSPAHIMKLVEIVKGKRTSTPNIALLQALTKRIQKLGVVVGNCDGFCGNRMLRPYGAEAAFLLAEGGAKTPAVVDKALASDFGMAMGIFTMGDLAGNDIQYNVRRELGYVREKRDDPVPSKRPQRYTELGDDLVSKLGRVGQKASKVSS